ncbi:ATP-dependent DNA helicase RecQ [Hypericibacter adhaerens]|uniref:DNA helicase RecQ n=1 Tax=Hypericibacter adhaerens TaxID=2602016 RepID=A0A5J6N299_9PROT|nr:DNA helicase RecQ [Hypericibacter adhaerens]QEX23115.1 ATP-dependent DNA helicase RecQ [Hypericibacter adhaerens]
MIAAPTLSPVHRAALASHLTEVFGFTALRPGQAQAIEALLGGRHVLAVMPTGAGKSLCYQLPALVLGGLTVVVSPLLALMRDQVAALRLNGIAAASINSDQSRDDNIAVWRRVQAGEVRLLYLSPERLMTEAMLSALAKLDLKLVAIDEAHCISQWGPAFRPEYEALSSLRERFPGVPIVGLTATADPATRADIAAKVFAGQVVSVVTGFDRPNLSLAVTLKDGWKKQVLEFVKARAGQSGIVYCLSRKKTEEVAALLQEAGHKALAFHAGMESAVKEQIQDRFMTEPGIVMVATIAFGMGIDKPDIRYVLHTDLPASPEAYYQEIGRAGRDGEPADTMMLYGLDDIRMRRLFIEQEESAPERKRREHKRLDALIAYCEAPECRRRMLLRYFGDESGPCGNCDVCLDPVETREGTAEAGLVLEMVRRTGQKFGAAHIVNLLRGAKNEKTASFGHEALPGFGAGAERGQNEWQGIIRQMVAAGLLDIDIQGYGGLRATPPGLALLKGGGSFRYRPDRLGKASRKERAASRATKGSEDLDAAGAELLQRLKALRLTLAKARHVPAYVIFSDRSLADMAAKRPRDETEFAGVFGVGEAKRREFGKLFLQEISSRRTAS